MDAIVADVGGTNTRMACVEGGRVVPDSVQRFVNDDHADFESIAAEFTRGRSVPSCMGVAIAGPASPDEGRLTNRDWTIRSAALSARFGVSHVTLINDLAALGYAVPVVPLSFLQPLTARAPQHPKGQALVVGMGTGFNVSPIRDGMVLAAEFGQASMPVDVLDALSQDLDDVSMFRMTEDLFCGSGLVRLHSALGHPPAAARDIASGLTPESRETMTVMARAMGVIVRQLAYSYWPQGGLYFNGALARSMFAAPWRDMVLGDLAKDTTYADLLAQMPAYLLTEDSAALYGCARFLAEHDFSERATA